LDARFKSRLETDAGYFLAVLLHRDTAFLSQPTAHGHVERK
jgi:hypothetical protein